MCAAWTAIIAIVICAGVMMFTSCCASTGSAALSGEQKYKGIDINEFPTCEGFGKLTDDLYDVNTGLWMIPVADGTMYTKMEVSPGRCVWFDAKEWDIQYVNFLPNAVIISDSKKYLQNIKYRFK
jgi:hypothetical protein